MIVFESGRALPSNQILVLGAIGLPVVATGAFFVYRFLRRPKDKEKVRRLTVNSEGRLGDATITDVRDNTVYYSYSIAGVAYTASQDIAQLREHIPIDPERLIGPTSLKYSPRNPANSIILCEQWSGLRVANPSRA